MTYRIEPRAVKSCHELPGLHILGRECTEPKICKYMTMHKAEDWLNKDCLCFSEPSAFVEPYEKIFYETDFEEEIGIKFKQKLTVLCMTPTTSCEASWKVYKYGKTKKDGKDGLTVQFVFDLPKLRECMAENASKLKDFKLYEGKIEYMATKTIDTIRTIGSDLYLRFFGDKKKFSLSHFLSLLLIKRPAFRYENELRFFLVNEKDNTSILPQLSFDFAKCTVRVVVDEEVGQQEFEQFKKLCHKKGIRDVRKHNLYNEERISPCFIRDVRKEKQP